MLDCSTGRLVSFIIFVI